ncbi:MAG: hydrophobe/amphiphile efflux-3 (HAE3) family transporter [Dehalococcoidales bacterium]
MVKRFSELMGRFVARRPWLLITLAVVISASLAPGVALLETESGYDTLISDDSRVFMDNERYEEQFGGSSMVVLLSGSLDDVFSTVNLATFRQFEQVIADDDRFRSVLSPLTLIDLAAATAIQAGQALEVEIATAQETAATEARLAAAALGLSPVQQEQAAQAAREQVLTAFQPLLDELAQIGPPSADNPLFVAAVVYEADGFISPQMETLIPDDNHALILVTPAGNMDDQRTLAAVQVVENYFQANFLTGLETIVIADVKLIDAIGRSIGGSMSLLFALSAGVMTLILFLMFRVRWRLLSLAMVGIGALWTFGLMGYLSIPISMATMAVLPILIGLGIDYSIQFHNRYQEELTKNTSVRGAVITSLVRMFPSVSIALLATLIGFVALYISDVPMIRDFGVILALGIALSYLIAIFLLYSVLYLGDRRLSMIKLSRASVKASGRIERALSWMARLSLKHPLPIFLIALILGLAGGFFDGQLPTNTDYEALMPQDLVERQEVQQLREVLGSGADIKLMLEADDVTSPDFLTWLKSFQETEVARYAPLSAANSPATLVNEAAGGVIPGREQIDAILEATPPLFTGQLISADREMASLSLTTTYLSMEEVRDLLKLLEEDALADGISISPVGTLALGSSSIDAAVSTRMLINAMYLGAIFIVLLAVYRSVRAALFTVIPVGLVIAWASLAMYAIGIPLNPLTSILGVIIIGIGTEFMVLLLGRYNEEKQAGLPPRQAMVVASSRIGRAIVTTALTTLGGFGVLIASDFILIRDFGIATVLGVFLSLVSTIVVMPPLIVWLDEKTGRRRA